MATAEEPVAAGESVVGVPAAGDETAEDEGDDPGAELDTPLVEELVHPATRTAAVVTHNADQIFILDITPTGEGRRRKNAVPADPATGGDAFIATGQRSAW